MGQTFVEGRRVPVTKVVAGPCVVTQIKKEDKDGYWAVQLGFGEKRIKNVTRPMQGHLRGVIKEQKAPRFLREIRLENEPTFKVGDIVSASEIFKVGDIIQVTGCRGGQALALCGRSQNPWAIRPRTRSRFNRANNHSGKSFERKENGRKNGWREGHFEKSSDSFGKSRNQRG
uniref:50S ribosomal protein L3, large subunit ribosomal protein L3 n=1 Tax=uncultured Microgenomates bacterium Rifle_16ft_4_minimus_24682 TaxID=1665111 RepID=A0A0H4TEX4_9BACT|nr:50S ribosomal protein L3, large subunit ribosomal protein L3 [uncultured Microgenomates bacterium Rifle_16ft_4_minimus_24682]